MILSHPKDEIENPPMCEAGLTSCANGSRKPFPQSINIPTPLQAALPVCLSVPGRTSSRHPEKTEETEAKAEEKKEEKTEDKIEAEQKLAEEKAAGACP